MSSSAKPEKKGEVNELRALLRTVNTEKDSKRKRDVIKKVIAYMTLGIDVSRLFSDMVLACNTKDLVIKKMVYLYLCSYAQSNPELTLLAINTLQKDCRDEDPMVRGLALRSLTGLRLTSILEYVMSPLKASLTDTSAYVRQAGVIGLLKVFHLAPHLIKGDGSGMASGGGFVETLQGMLRDRDPQVVINCIVALSEILMEEGGIAVTQPLIHYLLTRLKEFNDWGQCVVLELVAKYKPVGNEEEAFGIMNLLDPFLKVANSAVVLGTTKAFLNLTKDMGAELTAQVFLRLKTPILTILAASSPEISNPVLSHVLLICDRANELQGPGGAGRVAVFDEDFKAFFCKYNEPTHVKTLKMSILPRIANPVNSKEILSELAEYVGGGAGGGSGGVDADLARQAVRATGEIGVRVPQAADTVVESLLEALEMEAEYVRAATVMTMVDLLRVYPSKAPLVIPSLNRVLKRMEDAQGRAAVVWMLGEYGHLIEDAPYLLEPLIDSLAASASTSASSAAHAAQAAAAVSYKTGELAGVGGGVEAESDLVRNELLTATLKLFFKRPPEVQKMLGRLLKACLSAPPSPTDAIAAAAAPPPPSASASVRDRALLYYRLLKANVGEASAVVGGERAPVASGFHDEQAPEVKRAIWDEFNTLSVVYGKPASQFVSNDHRIIPLDAAAAASKKKAASSSADDDEGLLSQADSALPAYGSEGTSATTAAAAASGAGAAPVVDLLGADDLLGLGSSSTSTASSAAGGYGGVASSSLQPMPAAAPAPSASGLLGLASLYGGSAPAPAPAPAPVAAPMGGGGFGGGGGFSSMFGAAAPAPAPMGMGMGMAAGPAFRAGATLDPASYQSKWGAMQPSAVLQLRGGSAGHPMPAAVGELDALLRQAHVYPIASGDVGSSIKFYLFAVDNSTGSLHLWEMLLDKASNSFAITQKSENPMAAAAASQGITAALRPLLAPGQ